MDISNIPGRVRIFIIEYTFNYVDSGICETMLSIQQKRNCGYFIIAVVLVVATVATSSITPSPLRSSKKSRLKHSLICTSHKQQQQQQQRRQQHQEQHQQVTR